MQPMRIGPLGRMIEVRSPQAMPVEYEREHTELTLSTGQRVVYRAPRSARKWTWEIPWATDDEIDDLLALEQGVFGPGPFRWYDPMAAVTNMLPDSVASMGSGPAPWRWVAPRANAAQTGGRITLEDGRTLPNSISPTTTLRYPIRQGEEDPIPVLHGESYTASIQLEDGEGTLSLLWTDIENRIIDRTESGRGNGRLVVTGEAPQEACGVLMEISVGEPGQALNLRTGHVEVEYDSTLDITGDIDLRVTAALDSWATGAVQVLLAKYLAAEDQRSYELSIRPTGTVAFTWTKLGTGVPYESFRRAESTAPLPAVDGEEVTIRAIMDVENDDGVWEITFYYSTDDGAIWRQLGSTVTGTEPTSIYSSSSPLVLGAASNLSSPARGDYYSAEVRDGIDGNLVANADFRMSGPWQIGDDEGTSRQGDSGLYWTLRGEAEISAKVIQTLGSRIGGAQLTETSSAVRWRAGMGIPWVMLAGLEDYAYERLHRNSKFRTVSVTLIEVA